MSVVNPRTRKRTDVEIAALDAVSRRRALTEEESLRLERAIVAQDEARRQARYRLGI